MTHFCLSLVKTLVEAYHSVVTAKVLMITLPNEKSINTVLVAVSSHLQIAQIKIANVTICPMGTLPYMKQFFQAI